MHRLLIGAVSFAAAFTVVLGADPAVAQDRTRERARTAMGFDTSERSGARAGQSAARPGSDAWFWGPRDYYWGQNQPGIDRRDRRPRFRDRDYELPSYRYYPYYYPRYGRYYPPRPYSYGPRAPYPRQPYYSPRSYRYYDERSGIPPRWMYGRGGTLYDNFYFGEDWWDDYDEDWYDLD